MGGAAVAGETTGFTTWYAGLWFDEPLTLRAFRSLLSAGRFFGVPDDQTLEALLAASAQDQQEITDQLGLQVRHAVEILVQMIDRERWLSRLSTEPAAVRAAVERCGEWMQRCERAWPMVPLGL